MVENCKKAVFLQELNNRYRQFSYIRTTELKTHNKRSNAKVLDSEIVLRWLTWPDRAGGSEIDSFWNPIGENPIRPQVGGRKNA